MHSFYETSKTVKKNFSSLVFLSEISELTTSKTLSVTCSDTTNSASKIFSSTVYHSETSKTALKIFQAQYFAMWPLNLLQIIFLAESFPLRPQKPPHIIFQHSHSTWDLWNCFKNLSSKVSHSDTFYIAVKNFSNVVSCSSTSQSTSTFFPTESFVLRPRKITSENFPNTVSCSEAFMLPRKIFPAIFSSLRAVRLHI